MTFPRPAPAQALGIYLHISAAAPTYVSPQNPLVLAFPVPQGADTAHMALEITDPGMLEICSQLEREIQTSQKWDTAVGILRDVAAALTRFDWSEILDVTLDFVVFVIDWEMEGDHLAEILGASASKDQLREWKAKGWI